MAMHPRARALLSLVFPVLIATACAAPVTPGNRIGDAGPATSSVPKRLTVAIRGNAVVAYQKLNPRSNIPGEDSLERLAAAGLTVPNPTGIGRLARLAETDPNVDNGLWKVAPDGSMEVRWTIKQGAVWSDGVPITTDDMLFTAQVVRDQDLPIFSHVAYASMG